MAKKRLSGGISPAAPRYSSEMYNNYCTWVSLDEFNDC